MKLKPINAVQTSEEKKTAPRIPGRCSLKTIELLSQDQWQEDLFWRNLDGHNSRVAELTVQQHS